MLCSTSTVLEDRCIGLHLRLSRYVTWSSTSLAPGRLNLNTGTLTGAGHLLTDPQIMTNPYVLIDICIPLAVHNLLIIFTGSSFGKFLFGDGNITEAFNVFPVQHICNKYCEWFKLPTLQAE